MKAPVWLRLLQSGMQIAKRDLTGSSGRYKRYNGTAVEICRQVVADRWNGTFFEGGASIYANQFWIRDFGLFVEEIVELGLKKEVEKCLRWAVSVYKSAGKIGTVILGGDCVVDFWEFSADSLPMLLLTLKKVGLVNLIKGDQGFFNREVKRYFNQVLDPGTKLVKMQPFSTPKDVVVRKGTCVANSFLVFLNQLLDEDYRFLTNPIRGTDLKIPFMKEFWSDELDGFRNDLDENGDFLSADANVIPYYLGIVGNKSKHRSSINAIKREGLDAPFPLKYHSFFEPKWTHWAARVLIPNYQGDSIWTMMGPIYIKQEHDFYPERAKRHLRKYLDLIEKHKSYVEVFEPDGSAPLKGRMGHDFETGMLWAASIPSLYHQIGV